MSNRTVTRGPSNSSLAKSFVPCFVGRHPTGESCKSKKGGTMARVKKDDAREERIDITVVVDAYGE